MLTFCRWKFCSSRGFSPRVSEEAGQGDGSRTPRRLRRPGSRSRSSSGAPGWVAEEVGPGRRAEIGLRAAERRQPAVQSSAQSQFLRRLEWCRPGWCSAGRSQGSLLPKGLGESPAELSRLQPRGNQAPGGARSRAPRGHPSSPLRAGATGSACTAAASALFWVSSGERVNRPPQEEPRKEGRKLPSF